MNTRTTLAVLLHADVVGSTTLVQRDEQVAHVRIRDAFRLLSQMISEYAGQTREIRGDALVGEFNRASDAVSAALAFQTRNSEINAGYADDVIPVVRIGIALGEVVLADDTVTGDGVVLAQRLEQLAEPGGVCLQGAVVEAVPKRMPFKFEGLGDQQLKGFDIPIRAFTVRLSDRGVLPEPEQLETSSKTAKSSRSILVAAIGLGVVIAGALTVLKPWQPTSSVEPSTGVTTPATEPATTDSSTTETDKKTDDIPSIAVMPFENLDVNDSANPMARGIAEDIISDLSKIRELKVIARHSSFSASDSSTARTKALDLGVRFLVEGNVRRAGEVVRINAQLVDAQSESNVWGGRFDGSSENIFALHDEVIEQIVGALKITLSPEEERAVTFKETGDSEAYNLVLTGIYHLHEARNIHGFKTNELARAAFERALEIDPTYARAYAGLAWTHWNHGTFWFENQSRGEITELPKAWDLATKSVEIADNAFARRLLSKRHVDPDREVVSRYTDEAYELALDQLEKAVSIEPNNADALAELAYILTLAGEHTKAQTTLDKALELNPNAPTWYHAPAGIIAFHTGNYVRASEKLSIVGDKSFGNNVFVWLAAAYAHQGEIEAGRRALDIWTAGGAMVSNLLAIRNHLSLKRPRDIDQILIEIEKLGLESEPQPEN